MEPLVVGMVVYEGLLLEAHASILALSMTRPCVHSYKQTTDVAHGRNLVVREAMGRGPRLLLVDSDMLFHPDDVKLLEEALESEPERGAISAFYTKRDGSGLPVCGWRNGDGWLDPETLVKKCRILRGVSEVDSFGGGLLLIDMEVFEKAEFPWFGKRYDGEEYIGNDTFFCERLQAAGYKPSVHFDCRIGHKGAIVWQPQMFYPREN